ncbi:hypothetical protein AMECASPLE_019951 [Ameca splendens]|uniref:Uncharacterized protein n=1 Tax=Ameca splendens TaxID=208324 RepID=A0ABV0ZMY5_9TELE
MAVHQNSVPAGDNLLALHLNSVSVVWFLNSSRGPFCPSCLGCFLFFGSCVLGSPIIPQCFLVAVLPCIISSQSVSLLCIIIKTIQIYHAATSLVPALWSYKNLTQA